MKTLKKYRCLFRGITNERKICTGKAYSKPNVISFTMHNVKVRMVGEKTLLHQLIRKILKIKKITFTT